MLHLLKKSIAVPFMSCMITATAFSQTDNGGLQTAVAVDAQGEFGLAKPSESTDRFAPREAEFQFYAPIDHLFDGSASFAAHNEQGQYAVELHEAFVSSSKIIPRTRFRLGKFFLGIGKLNQTHRHDWAFISAPKVHEEIFGDEAAADSGGEVTTILPLPFFLELMLGSTNGWTFGHTHGEGNRPKSPTAYGRLTTFMEIGTGGLQIGGNYFRRDDSQGTKMNLFGVDLTLKLKGRGRTLFLVQSEYWRRSMTLEFKKDESNPDQEAPGSEISQGLYVFPEIYPTKTVGLGLRFDYFAPPPPTEEGAEAEETYMGYSPQITYKPSEFSRFRIAFNFKKGAHAHEHTEAETAAALLQETEGHESKTQYQKSIEVQATFILGAHPAHDF